MRMDITGGIEVEGESYNDGRNAADFSAGRVSCVGNTYFRHNILYK